MSRCVHINLELLKALVKLKSQPRLSLLRVADKSLVTAISECALNILNGNVPIKSSKVKSELFKEKQAIRHLAQFKTCWKSKRQLIARKSEKLIPLVIDIVLKHLQNEPREEDGSHISGCITET